MTALFLMSTSLSAPCPGEPRTMVVGPQVSAGASPPTRGRCSIGDTDALKDVREVSLDGFLLDVQPSRDLLVGKTLADQLENLALAGREILAWPALCSAGQKRPRCTR